jgi:hypothetical protein
MLTPASEQNFKKTIATNHLSTLLQLAPKPETLRLTCFSLTYGRLREDVNVNELRSLR